MTTNRGEDETRDSTDPTTRQVFDTGDESLSLDTILSLLADTSRRDILHLLREASQQTCAVDDCIAHIQHQAHARTGSRPGRDDVATSLYHVHLPKLAEAEMIEYDTQSQTIRYCEHERLEDWFEHIRDKEQTP